MIKLETVFSSNIPIDCHILKGRLESEGINCFLFDENIVWVHPFKAVAIGGVKLKVTSDRYDFANKILTQVKKQHLSLMFFQTQTLTAAMEKEHLSITLVLPGI